MRHDANDPRNPRLGLHEEITLLALRDEQGTFQIGPALAYAVGGAILAELLLSGAAETTGRPGKLLLVSKRGDELRDPILEECRERVAHATRRATPRSWVSRFAHTRGLSKRLIGQLCRRGILREDEDRVWGLFRRRIYPERDPLPEQLLIQRMREVITSNTREVDPWTIAIISLAQSAGLLKLIFDRRMLRRRKPRIDRLVSGELVGKATHEAISAMQAALIAATSVPTMVTTAACH